MDFPYIHNLGKLIRLVRDAGVTVPNEVTEARALTIYAVTTRYPGPSGQPIDAEELADAVRVAEAVVDWAQREIVRASDSADPE